ncbi:MAG: aminoacetone oxidase family FAD-binding enzyme, partial [Gammaproteobacteria bacterium]|nr:aminoacetone oxidase family FAD-binding enzyme [Gammaproteobacteria bacterium]
MSTTDVIIIGAGAAGLMCAIEAGRRGRKVVILDHARKPGNKIRMAGGGRCNFTNYDVSAEHYLSHNRHFVKSALSRFTQWDFLALVQRYQIPFHERDHGQLFCDDSSEDILNMLPAECRNAGVDIQLKSSIKKIEHDLAGGFTLHGKGQSWQCESLVIATGGLSIPTAGATPLGYRIAEQFGIKVWPPSAGLVPFTLQPEDKRRLAPLSGIAVDATVSCEDDSFRENVLFTHRGLSGPAILQISNFWQPGQEILIDWLPDTELGVALAEAARKHPRQQLKTFIGQMLPQRLVALLLDEKLATRELAKLTDAEVKQAEQLLKAWCIKPAGTEGYRTAEVTRGGVDCDAVSSKTMEVQKLCGLYFVGEVLDVTGWLGGYNLQWAWSSGWCAG